MFYFCKDFDGLGCFFLDVKVKKVNVLIAIREFNNISYHCSRRFLCTTNSTYLSNRSFNLRRIKKGHWNRGPIFMKFQQFWLSIGVFF